MLRTPQCGLTLILAATLLATLALAATAQPPCEQVCRGAQNLGARVLGAATPSETEQGTATAVLQEARVVPPHDPCLPPLFWDWNELSRTERESPEWGDFKSAEIVLDLKTFSLTLLGVRGDGSVESIYETPVGVGQGKTPTPTGQFIINHVYSYPDVCFFAEGNQKVPELYAGFFAPLLLCDEHGKCERYQDLGIHGFNAAAYPHPSRIRHETEGEVSGGCIRLPDPCAFKSALIRLVGVGSVKRNDRGSYHWLNKPVAVSITDGETGILSVLQDGALFLQNGLMNVLKGFTE
ncbi:MAG: L,D-transpeptidase [Thermodesulfobacteriota bacterium]